MSNKTRQRSMSLLVMFTLMFSLVSSVFAAPTGTSTQAPAQPAANNNPPPPDSCGYPNTSGGLSATVFNESTITRSAAVYGVGLNAKIGVFSNDEKAMLLGVNGSVTQNTSEPQHVSNPNLGDTTLKDPSLRVFYPVLYITDITSNAADTSGDWQHSPNNGTTFIDDIFGTWSTATLVGTTYTVNTPNSQNHWNLGVVGPTGPDAPPAGTTTFDEGYGAEVRWNASSLGVVAGHTYRFQILTHDGDQNKDGGDAGEQCVNLTIPLPPTLTTTASAGVDLGGNISDIAHLTGGANPQGSITFKAYGPDTNCDPANVAFTSSAIPVNGAGNYGSGNFKPTLPGLYLWRAFYSGVAGDANNPATNTPCGDDNESVTVKAKPAIETVENESVTIGTAITDSAKLTNATADADGTITFKVYSNDTCTTLVATRTVDLNGGGNGTYGPVSVTVTAPGTYYWIASYGGDSRNVAVAGTCKDSGETDTVIKAKPAIVTLASGDHATPNTVNIGSAISDTATLSGGYSPTGTISFNLFGPGDLDCTGTPIAGAASTKTVTGNGDYTSDAYTPPNMGKYRWIASYSGDTNNDPVAGKCNDAHEDVIVKPATPSIATTLHGPSNNNGSNITVALGSTVTDSSTLTGATTTATGTVKYTIYNNADCLPAHFVFDAGTKTITNPGHVIPNSDPYTFNTAGTFYWQAEYSGDNNNIKATSTCDLETVTVPQNKPTVVTQASASVQAGSDIWDTATLAGGFNPTGTITFNLYGPGDTTCATSIAMSTATVTANGNYDSAKFTTVLAGTYHWIANYGGDTNNEATANVCNGTNESVIVTKKTTAVVTQASASVVVGGKISDTATLSGGVNPTGTITFKLYGPNAAATPRRPGEPVLRRAERVHGNGDYTSDEFTTNVAGIWHWVANYSGDDNNAATANVCNGTNENVTVTKKSPTISTLATDGGVPGDKISDTAALTGAFLPTTGTVTFNLYGPGDETCTGTVTATSTVNISGTGTATSADFTTILAGTYHWIASYSGDTNNDGVTGKCTDEHETTVISKFNPEITTSLSSANVTSAAKITILFGASVTDQATLTKFGPGAGGTVTYTVWSDSECKVWYADGGIKDVSNGVPGVSDSVNFPTPGKYYWTADYSGDVNNAPANSACGAEVVTVTTPHIVVEKTVDTFHTTTANPGDTLHYSISITNTGDAAGSVSATDDITAILAHASIQPGDISDGGEPRTAGVTWPQFSLAPEAQQDADLRRDP